MTAHRFELARPGGLGEDVRAAWRAWTGQDALSSPFFSLGFLDAVSAVRDDVRVVVIRDGGRPVGCLPLHLKRFGVAAPLGGPISDYHGLIGEGGVLGGSVEADALLKGAGLAAYDYNHTPAGQAIFAERAHRRTASPRIDLTQGFDGWRASTSGEMKQIERRMRKLAREVGPLTFEARTPLGADWEAFKGWKRAALAQIGATLAFDEPWIEALAHRLCQGPDPLGAFSTLRAGDRLVAAHFGMRTGRDWHWWFPTYDFALRKYSPGNALLHETVRSAAGDGLVRVDLGRGDERYKHAFANASCPLVEGSLTRTARATGLARRAARGALAMSAPILPPRAHDLARRALDRALGAARL